MNDICMSSLGCIWLHDILSRVLFKDWKGAFCERSGAPQMSIVSPVVGSMYLYLMHEIRLGPFWWSAKTLFHCSPWPHWGNPADCQYIGKMSEASLCFEGLYWCVLSLTACSPLSRNTWCNILKDLWPCPGQLQLQTCQDRIRALAE